MGSIHAAGHEPSHVVRSAPDQAELLRTLADTIPAMLAYWDASMRCRFANRAYERWFGVSPESLLGAHIRELLGPLYELNLPYIEGALRGEPQEFEREIPDPRGGPSRHGLANYVPDVVDGVVRGFYVVVTDISAVKRAELALREAEEQFRLTIDEAPIGMALVAPDGRFSRVNRVLCELVGYTREELTGLTFQAITHPEDLDVDLALAGQLARGEIPRYDLEKRYVRKDGTVVDVMLSGSALRGPDGTPRHYIAQIVDITDRKRSEREQRFLAEVGPLLADTTLDLDETLSTIASLAVRDLADLCIVDVVEEDDAIRRLEVRARDPERAWIADVLARVPLDRRRPYLLRSAFETRSPVLLQRPSAEALASLAQGEEHHRALRAADIRSMLAVPMLAHGQLLGVIALVSSTDARTYGAADVSLAEELARRAALSILNARLYRAARQATRARDEVLGVVAHDLRSPLNAILMQAALLGQSLTPPDERARHAAARIERSAKRMVRLIQDLLDVTRTDAGRLSLEGARLSARQLAVDAVDAHRLLGTSAALELRLDLAPALPEIWGDRDRLLQVFDNLIGNALRFTPAGGRVTVGAAPRGGEVLFWVADTGSGIAPEDVPHVFDRFWRANEAERHGAGLGLAIVEGVVDAHRGRVWVESAEGEGTTFFFTVPTAERAEPPGTEPDGS